LPSISAKEVNTMIAAIVPAHNEESEIAACIESLQVASSYELLNGEAVLILVVADACDDRTAAIARKCGAQVLCIRARNVGSARSAGAQFALRQSARWLSFTDADTTVAPDWLFTQLSSGHDAVCGTVTVNSWEGYSQFTKNHYERTYLDADGHRHIHGANLGISAEAYVRSGGFTSLRSSEDVALVEALRRTGASIAWSAKPRVITSSRANFRAPDGFGATLQTIERRGACIAEVTA
jgi:glycosyltransferase involved in cell wall biosynthesis